jgi:hypothetical protein
MVIAYIKEARLMSASLNLLCPLLFEKAGQQPSI